MPLVRMPPEWGTEPVPPEARRLRTFDFFVLWFSLGVGLLVLIAGSLLTLPGGDFRLDLVEAALVIVVGSIVGSLMLGAAGVIGSRYGVPSMVSLRAILGREGSWVPTAMNVLQLLGWASFEVMVMGEAAASLLGQGQGSVANYALVALFGGFCALLALGGPLVVVRQWLEKFAVWLVIGSTVWITYLVFTQGGGVAWGAFRTDAATMLLAVDLVIVMPISWWPLISDYNRFARRAKDGFAGSTFGYSIANTWFFLLGAAIIVILGTENVISSILALTLGLIALFLILVDETDNGFANVYSTAVSLQNFLPRVRQRRFVVLVAGIAVVIGGWLTSVGGLFGAAAFAYEGFLFVIGGAFVPLLGVLVGDYLLVRRGAYDPAEFYEGGVAVHGRAFIAWGAGALAYFYLLLAPGLGWPSLTLGSSLPAFATSLAVQFLLSRTRAGAVVRPV